MSESRFEVLVRAAAAAFSETGVSEFGGGSGMVICVVGVLTWKTDPGVGVVGDAALRVTESDGLGATVPVGVTAPSVSGILSLWSELSRALLLLLEDDGRDANSCAPRRGGG